MPSPHQRSAKRVLITGADGFVGKHLCAALLARGNDAAVLRTCRRSTTAGGDARVELLDVRDARAVEGLLSDFRPSHVVNLAGISTLAEADADVDRTWQVHLQGSLNIARAILRSVPDCVMLAVGSGEMYGSSALSGMPLDEQTVLAPVSEYAASKAAADLAIGALTRKGLRAVRLRPFNHSGPGQSDRFALPAFARQIAAIELGGADPVIKVGNLEAERDIVDVRDVVEAYITVIEGSDKLPSNAVFNIASGKSVRIGDLLDLMLSFASKKIRIEPDPGRMRAIEIPRYVGNANLAREVLGWKPEFTISRTLRDMYDAYRSTTTPS
ncbi:MULTISPECIES: GDP-mannose 4,6-dehydratase [unclassified Bradyrhizobium]|uniref:GDP-mannose 4,6-dehydratase n=1 Tax=unclassified Bradyrhizobium TaxID=2631580 RepID=UPI0028E75CF7|nr:MULTISPECIES: GDP-mannose 4,6-dehydratase [unclassified Bradyrhizobium]